MTRYELLKLNRTFLQTLVENKISPSDVCKLEIYEKYKDMIAQHHKVTYIVTHLADKYGLKERAIYTLIKRFDSEITL